MKFNYIKIESEKKLNCFKGYDQIYYSFRIENQPLEIIQMRPFEIETKITYLIIFFLINTRDPKTSPDDAFFTKQ